MKNSLCVSSEVLYTLPWFCSKSKNELLPLIKELVTSNWENAKACPNHVEFFQHEWTCHTKDLLLKFAASVTNQNDADAILLQNSWMILQPAYQVIYMLVVPNVGAGLIICTIILLIILSMLHAGKNVWSFTNDYSRGKRDFQIAALYLRDIFNI